MAKNYWYISGLCFECIGCGRCCQGPEEGYIWASETELKMIADELKMDLADFKQRYTKKYFTRRSIVEEPFSKDCIFLQGNSCQIYHKRPNQCRTWPFWDMNLVDADSWNQAGVKCPGINRGKLYSFEEIEKIRKQKRWWTDDDKSC